MNGKNCILDPITCLCKLALLYFYPDAKLRINDNALEIQEPSVYRTIVRIKYSDSREDIFYLHQPIIRAIQWYLHTNEKNAQINEDTKNNIINITKFAIKGLVELQKTYKCGNVVLTLQYYIIILQNAIAGTFNEITTYQIEDSDVTIAEKIKQDFQELNDISNMLNSAENQKNNPEKLNNYLNFIRNSLEIRDTNFRKIVVMINTTI
jgi:hypothetical protein